MVTPAALGAKRTCPSCNNRFYDLGRRPVKCPKCNHSYDPTVVTRARKPKRVAAESMEDQDLLLQHMAKSKAPVKKKQEAAEDEGFDDIGPGADESLEELEDIDDIEALEEIDDTPDEDMDDDVVLEDDDVGDENLIDAVEDVDDEEAEEETSRKKASVPAKKRKK